MLPRTGGPAAAFPQQTYSGPYKCELVTNRDGLKWADMSCGGSYPNSGNCQRPSSRQLFQKIPPACGEGSYISDPIHCIPNAQPEQQGAAFRYVCGTTGIDRTVTKLRPNCTVTCNAGTNPTWAAAPLIAGSQCAAGGGCTQFTNVDSGCACVPDPGNMVFFGESGGADASTEDYENCFGICDEDLGLICLSGRCSISPVVIDVKGDGFNLTDQQGGVDFDLNADGLAERVAWTVGSADEAFLSLDRNGNGVVDDGRELFGSVSPQPDPPEGVFPNGFNALKYYDRPENGGNGDSVIDKRDAIFLSLRLWQDIDHNGVSEAGELHTLPQLGLESIDLDYKESKHTDEHGNQFRYRAKVGDAKGAKINRWAWDVFLITTP